MTKYVRYLGWITVASVILFPAISFLVWFLQNPDDLPNIEQLRVATDVIRQLLMLSIFAGVASMASVQTIKHLFRIRGQFHTYELTKQFGSQFFDLLGFEKLRNEQLVTRLDIPLEQLMAMIGAAAEQAILQPDANSKFLIELGGGRLKEPLNTIAEENNSNRDKKEDDLALREAYALLRSGVEQGLDSLQITLGSRWRLQVRFWAAVIAGLIGLVALLFSEVNIAGKVAILATTFILGGAFSWLARDIAAGIERWRG